MKLSQVKPMTSTQNVTLPTGMKKLSDKKIKILNAEFTLSELRSIYKIALQRLSHDTYGRK